MKASFKFKFIFIILIILLFGVSTVLLAEGNNDSAANSDQNNSPKYQIKRPPAVIKVNPLDGFSNKQNQINMEVSWHNNNQDSDQDLEFTLNDDLVLTSSNQSNNIAHGFVSTNNRSSYKIPAAEILISINGNEYLKFNEGIKVLEKGKISSELKFKIKEEWLRSNWTDVTAGVYKADIDVNLDQPGNKPRLQVIIESAAVIDLSGNKSIDLTIENPREDKSSNSISWEVNGNGGSYQVEFKSAGIEAVEDDKDEKRFVKYKEEDNSINYSSFFKYSFSDNPDHSFVPGEIKTVNIKKGELSLNYSPGEYEEGKNDWYQLLAGPYQDQVTITVWAD